MASVWGELKRRKVVKVAVAYAVAGWLLVEVASTVFPILQIPDWAVAFVTMLLLLGYICELWRLRPGVTLYWAQWLFARASSHTWIRPSRSIPTLHLPETPTQEAQKILRNDASNWRIAHSRT